jgi:hypothetical protein
VRVLNGAVSAYGLQQIRSSVAELLALEPRLVVLGLYPRGYWRLDDPYVLHKGYVVSSSSRPHYDVVADGLVYSRFHHPVLVRLHLWCMQHYWTGAHLLEIVRDTVEAATEPGAGDDEEAAPVPAEEQLRPFLAELGRIDRLCRDRATPLVVLLVNSQDGDGRFNAREKAYNAVVAAFAREAGIPLLDPVPVFERLSRRPVFRIGGDAHWSRHAHLVAGRQLAAFLLAEEPVRRLLLAGDDEARAAGPGGGGEGHSRPEPAPLAGRER